MRSLGSAIFVAVTLWCTPASADFVSYEKLFHACQARVGIPAEATRWGICFGYIAGLADAFQDGETVRGQRACLPGNVKIDQVWQDVLGWMRKHPGNLIGNASTQVVLAMSELYPCDP